MQITEQLNTWCYKPNHTSKSAKIIWNYSAGSIVVNIVRVRIIVTINYS